MISAPRPPSDSTTSCGTAFTVAAVPTGINTGVCTAPWGSVSSPRRPPSAHAAPTSKRSDIAPHSIASSVLLRFRCRGVRRWRRDQDVALALERTNLHVLELFVQLVHLLLHVIRVERVDVSSG